MSETINYRNGIYVFHSPDCWTCQDHLENFEKSFKDFILINVESDRKFFENIGVTLVPHTRVYKDGEIIYEETGMLFDKQIEELKKVL